MICDEWNKVNKEMQMPVKEKPMECDAMRQREREMERMHERTWRKSETYKPKSGDK